MRRAIVLLSAAVLLAILGAFFFVSSSIDRYQPQIEAQLGKKLNRQVKVGHLGLHLFPFAIKVESLTIDEAPAFRSPRPFATASDVFVSVGLLSLLHGNPDVKSLRLSRPQIELIRNQAGIWNYATLGSNDANGNSQSRLSLDELQIQDGQVGFTDEQAKISRAIYDHIDVDLLHFGPNQPFDIEFAVHLPGTGKQLLNFKGQVGPINAKNAAATPLKGHLSAQELSLSSLNRLSPGTFPHNDDGIATADADISTDGNLLICKGDLKLVDAVLHGSKLGFPVSARFDMTADRASDLLTVRSGSLGLAQTSFGLSGTIDSKSKPANANLHIVTTKSSLSEIAKLAASLGIATDSSYVVKGLLTADFAASGPISAPQLTGSLSARDLQVSGGEIKQAVAISAIDLALSPQLIRSNEFTAQSGSTALSTQFSLSQYQSTAPQIEATVKTANANIEELLNMAKAYGVDGSRGATATGKLSLDIQLKGPMKNASALVIAGTGQINSARLVTPVLTKPVAITSADFQFAQNSVSIHNLNAAIGSTTLRGSVSANNFAAPEVQFILAADKIDTAELQRLTRSTATQNQGHAISTGHATPPSPSESLLTKATGAGTLSANSIKAQNFLLTNFHAACKLNHGLITLSPVTTDLFGGKEAGTIALDVRPVHPLCSVNAKFTGVDSNALLTAVSSMKDTLYGKLAADSNLSLSLEEASADLAKTLNGTVGFNLTGGHLKNVNITNEISRIGKFLNPAGSTNSSGTDLKKLSGTLDIKNGVASTNNLIAGLDAGSFSANGLLNLIDQGLNLHVTAVLSSGVSQSVGGSGVGGYLNTALANNKGELVLPVIVTGTTSHPVFTPDIQALAKMKLANLLPTSTDPAKLTSGVIGAIGGKGGAGSILNQVLGGSQKKADQKPTDNQTTQDPINSILQQFGKKKPKQ